MLNSLVENVLNYFTDNFSETSFYLNFWSLLPPTKANFFSTTRMNLNTVAVFHSPNATVQWVCVFLVLDGTS